MCPTRELANQVASEAKKLLKYYPSVGAQVVIGGTRLSSEQRNMQANPCQVNFSTSGPPLCLLKTCDPRALLIVMLISVNTH